MGEVEFSVLDRWATVSVSLRCNFICCNTCLSFPSFVFLWYWTCILDIQQLWKVFFEEFENSTVLNILIFICHRKVQHLDNFSFNREQKVETSVSNRSISEVSKIKEGYLQLALRIADAPFITKPPVSNISLWCHCVLFTFPHLL